MQQRGFDISNPRRKLMDAAYLEESLELQDIWDVIVISQASVNNQVAAFKQHQQTSNVNEVLIATRGYKISTMSLQRLDEYVRSNVGVSERGSMQQWQAKHEVVLGHGRRQKAQFGGGDFIRLLWISGYITVTLGALFSTFFYIWR